jgi:tartrate dehydrogenase/decarboxylase/D-malate dehydrogenase
MREYKGTAIPGDGIGTGYRRQPLALQVLADATAGSNSPLSTSRGATTTAKHSYYIPEGGLAKLTDVRRDFFGAVGAPTCRAMSLWGLRLPVCQGFDQYANVRPARVLPGNHGRSLAASASTG